MTAIDTPDAHGVDDHDHPEHLGHHWNTLDQQFEASKLGMWLFLATEFLLFGGLFVAYAVLRFNRPEVFEYGSQFLDTRWGAINTVILILSSLTMALAVTAAQRGQRQLLVVLLGLTFLGGLGFMCIKYVEYEHKLHYNIKWGTGFYAPVHVVEDDAHGEGAGHAVVVQEDDAVAAAAEPVATETAPVVVMVDGLEIPQSAVAPAAIGAPGLVSTEAELMTEAEDHDATAKAEVAALHDLELHHATDESRPPNAHLFFGIYFIMTGLHGIHVLVGMGVIAWLGIRAARGAFSPQYFTPVDLGGLYWHVVDLIWIFLFPLLYLIG